MSGTGGFWRRQGKGSVLWKDYMYLYDEFDIRASQLEGGIPIGYSYIPGELSA